MSKFCGKCDFADSIEIRGVDKILEAEIYVGNKKLEAETYKDLIPYLAYIVGIMASSDGRMYIRLSRESYVDTEEKDTLNRYLKDALRIYNRCKRKKTEFNTWDAITEICWNDYNLDVITEIVNRVNEKGRKADIEGVHTQLGELYRRNLVREMLEHGLDPSEYGLERFINIGEELKRELD